MGIYDGNACGICSEEKIKAPHLVIYYLKLEARLWKIQSEAEIMALQAYVDGAKRWAGGFGKLAALARGEDKGPSASKAETPEVKP
jgi:hypothetical protein